MKKRIILSIIFSVLTIGGSVSAIAVSNSIVNKSKTNTEDLIAYVDVTSEQVEETTTVEENTTEEVTTTVPVTKTTQEYVVSGIVEAKGNVSTTYLNQANREMNKVPTKVLNIFVNAGWHIYVTDENIAETYFAGAYSSVQGVTDYQNKMILIEDRSNAISGSIIHEFGHFLDYYLNFTSDSTKFQEIYNEEVSTFKSNITNSSCVRDSREFFAEEFYYYYKNSSKCTTKAYEYITNIINNL